MSQTDGLEAQFVTLLGLTYLIFALQLGSTLGRIYARVVVLRIFRVDDMLAAFSCKENTTMAQLCCVCGMPMIHIVNHQFRMLLDVAERRDRSAPTQWDKLSYSLKLNWLLNFSYILSLSTIKLSILLFYRTILPRKPYHLLVNILSALTVAFAVATFFASMFQCMPVQWAWDFTKLPMCNVNLLQLSIAISYFNLTTDVLILLLPTPVVAKLQVSLRRRLALLALFSLGLIGTLATALRTWKTWRVAAVTKQLGGYDPAVPQWLAEMTHFIMLSALEVSIITVCANAPALAGWWRARARAARTTASGSGTRRTGGGGGGGGGHSRSRPAASGTTATQRNTMISNASAAGAGAGDADAIPLTTTVMVTTTQRHSLKDGGMMAATAAVEGGTAHPPAGSAAAGSIKKDRSWLSLRWLGGQGRQHRQQQQQQRRMHDAGFSEIETPPCGGSSIASAARDEEEAAVADLKG